MHIGVLTGGGDCPGLNAVLRALVRRAAALEAWQLTGFQYGWAGVMTGKTMPLTRQTVAGILPRGGTILGTSRVDPLKEYGGIQQILDTLERMGIDCLVSVGGEGTQAVAQEVMQRGFNVVGIPKTIDNDVRGTDYSVGFQTAVQVATDAIDRIHSTAESHSRVMIVEVMGRSAGWIAMYSGMAGGADAILIPEVPFDIDEVATHISQRKQEGRLFSVVVVAEGARPAEGTGFEVDVRRDHYGYIRYGGIGMLLQDELERRTGSEARATILGHVQRGGTPCAFDRVLASRFGIEAVDAAAAGNFGTLTALRGAEIELIPLSDVGTWPKTVDVELYREAEVFFG